jgi:hypothetical protein
MAIIPINNATISYNTTEHDTTQSPFTNNSNTNSSGGGGGGNNSTNGFIIAIEVIFSLLVLVILLFCFLVGLKKKKRIRKLTEDMIENAINQQERRIQMHLYGHCHSSSTVTSLIQYPPPSYSPPDPSNQLSNDVVSRLDHLLLENQICSRLLSPTSSITSVAVSNSATLPKYSDLYQDGVNRPT